MSVAAVVLSKLNNDREGGALVAMVAAPMIVLMAACGALYAYLDPWSAACFGLAPACIGLGFKREGGWSQTRVFGAAALLCALGLGLAYLGAPAPTPYDY